MLDNCSLVAASVVHLLSWRNSLVMEIGKRASRCAVTRIQQSIRSFLRRRQESTDFETSLVVLVPSAEAHIVDLRRSSNANTMSAHITVPYPFVRTSLLTSDVVSRLRATFLTVEPFSFELTEVGWFEERVLYLVPTPATPFQQMTELLASVFPVQKPYSGDFAEVIPHLTVAEGVRKSKLRDAARVVTEVLPIAADVDVVCLMVQDATGNWTIHTTFELGR